MTNRVRRRWQPRADQICSIEGCEKPLLARGWCAMHYQRWYTRGEAGLAGLRRRPSDPVAFSKVCSRCTIEKPVTEFYADRATPTRPANLDGRSSRCKACAGIEVKERRLVRKYGITGADYRAMALAQGGRCLICRLQPPNGRPLVVDHDHRTDAVRGLLCDYCNTLLGLAADDPDRLREAADYLESTATTSVEEAI